MDIKVQLKNKTIMYLICLSNSVFGTNSASMLSENFIMKYMMQQYLFSRYRGISYNFCLACSVNICFYELLVTNIPDTVHRPANSNIRIGYGTFDRCGPGTVV